MVRAIIPSLYLNDGQNLFEPATSFNGVEWQVDETADRLIRERQIPPLIIVGIDNAGKDRIREYMPHRSFQPMMLRVQGTRYPSFLIKEVMPFRGAPLPGRIGSSENTGFGGSSLGALIALYTVAVSPGMFGRLLLESPSLWASNRQMIRQSRTVRRWPERVFSRRVAAEAGARIGIAAWSMTYTNSLQSSIVGVWTARRLRLVVDQGAPHHESAWARRFPDALSFLFAEGERGSGADAKLVSRV